jgi:hypothetical protein
MAHFAELDNESNVLRVLAVANAAIAGGESEEQAGKEFLQSLYGHPRWVQTSYNAQFRKRFACAGMKYDAARDAFIRPQLYPSWQLDEATCEWIAPVPVPQAGRHRWNESQQAWVAVTLPPMPG